MRASDKSPVNRPRTEEMSTLRERISAAAQELYLRDGLEGFSMRKVADIVGCRA